LPPDFARWLDPTRRSLARDGEPLALRPQAMEVLCHLARHAGRRVSKSELFKAIWPQRARRRACALRV
jgi:DNA-binding winged helix-turn-helix (wHTH) protein